MISNYLLPILLAACLCQLKSFAQAKPSAGASGQYNKLVWADEFEREGPPDSLKWGYEQGYVRNKELQYYTKNRKQNASVQDGYLVITALNESFTLEGRTHPITSASLITKKKKDWTYGRIEVRAKIPSSLGTWPAIWTLGSNIEKVGWPACGEIDILEHVGYQPEVVHFNVHTKKYNHAINTGKGIQIPYTAPYNDFHVYAIEWFKDRIDWYMDEQKVNTYQNEGEGASSWPFDQPQYLILNLAFGGAWGGTKGVDITTLPQQLLVDYVRVYQ
jgi:beta-glucanase (GH16 family)